MFKKLIIVKCLFVFCLMTLPLIPLFAKRGTIQQWSDLSDCCCCRVSNLTLSFYFFLFNTHVLKYFCLIFFQMTLPLIPLFAKRGTIQQWSDLSDCCCSRVSNLTLSFYFFLFNTHILKYFCLIYF